MYGRKDNTPYKLTKEALKIPSFCVFYLHFSTNCGIIILTKC
ncbi:hypothetical protein HMPREF3181_00895 [Parvimonas sp. KA00067]|nr:hypothetical protein HMPREF3181_00895 [Parvimonas sp. KA00067]